MIEEAAAAAVTTVVFSSFTLIRPLYSGSYNVAGMKWLTWTKREP